MTKARKYVIHTVAWYIACKQILIGTFIACLNCSGYKDVYMCYDLKVSMMAVGLQNCLHAFLRTAPWITSPFQGRGKHGKTEDPGECGHEQYHS